MTRIDGVTAGADYEAVFDVVVVGSGPAGAAAARAAALAGAKVAIVEEGRWFEPPANGRRDGYAAMADWYRDMGASVMLGRAPMPYLQGRAVGGSSVINGAISWRLPRDVHDAWIVADPALEAGIPWSDLEAVSDDIETELSIQPTDPSISGNNDRLLAKGASALQIAHRPTRRNVSRCEGLGRCLEGCPKGRKRAMDSTYLLDAERLGAVIISSTRVFELTRSGDTIDGVVGLMASGRRARLGARRAVVLAASAVQTPALLLSNSIRHGPIGRHFQCHPGVAMAGRFQDSVRLWEGSTQGHEVTGLRKEGLKFEALGYDAGVAATRLGGFGVSLARESEEIGQWAHWGVAVRAVGEGRVGARRDGRAKVTFELAPSDVAKMRRGLRVMGDMMLAAGAEFVTPGVHGFDKRVEDPARLGWLEANGPSEPRAFSMAVTHMFGTCRMGSRRDMSVVRPDFRHHTLDRLYVADSSLFPTNTGVNPQTSIIALATLCGRSAVS